MKKIFTFLAVAAISITVATAQGRDFKNDRSNDRDISYGNSSQQVNSSSYFFTERERDAQISRINREYDFKISMVQRDRYLRSRQKTTQIRLLEKQRIQEIKIVQQRWLENLKRHNGYSKNKGRNW